MHLDLLQKEIGIPGENLRYLVESNGATLFSYVTKATLLRELRESRTRALVTVVRDTCTKTLPLIPLYHCATNIP